MKTMDELRDEMNRAKQAYDAAQAQVRSKYDDLVEQAKGKTKEQIIELVWQLPPLPLYHRGLLLDCGFLTGSSVFSSAKPADKDYVVNLPPHMFNGYALNCLDTGYEEVGGMTAVYAHSSGMIVNILCVSDIALYKAWEKTTQRMIQLHESGEDFSIKWKRVRVFRAFLDIYYNKPALPKDRQRLDLPTAINIQKCRYCEREAIYFTTAARKKHFLLTGQCERCEAANVHIQD